MLLSDRRSNCPADTACAQKQVAAYADSCSMSKLLTSKEKRERDCGLLSCCTGQLLSEILSVGRYHVQRYGSPHSSWYHTHSSNVGCTWRQKRFLCFSESCLPRTQSVFNLSLLFCQFLGSIADINSQVLPSVCNTHSFIFTLTENKRFSKMLDALRLFLLVSDT